MDAQKFTLALDSHTDQIAKIMIHLLTSGELSDVTLVCDDQVKFKAHKFILKQCSKVFESILEETDDKIKSIVFLRGVNHEDLRSILEFIYCGQTTLDQERMQDFLEAGKDLLINEIKNWKDNEENGRNAYPEDDSYDDDKYLVKSNNGEMSSQEEITPRSRKSKGELLLNSAECPQCNMKFSQRSNMLKHYRNVHDGKRISCNYCSYQTTEVSNLKRHLGSKHSETEIEKMSKIISVTSQIGLQFTK